MRRALKEYIYYLKINKNLSINTIEAYERDILQYITFMENTYKIKYIKDIKKEYLTNYLNKLVRDKISKTSERRKISSINSFNNYLIKESRIDSNQISKNVSPKIDKKIPVVLSIDEMNRLIEASKGDSALDKRNYAMISLLYGSGLRISELIDLKLENIHVNNRLINVYGKGSKERIVPLNKDTVDALREYILKYRLSLKPNDASIVFINKNGDKISRVGVFKLIKDLAIKANINKEISPHTLRHTFATHLLSGGADIMAVKELLGHENVGTTEFYTHVSKKTIFDKYKEIQNRGNKDEI